MSADQILTASTGRSQSRRQRFEPRTRRSQIDNDYRLTAENRFNRTRPIIISVFNLAARFLRDCLRRAPNSPAAKNRGDPLTPAAFRHFAPFFGPARWTGSSDPSFERRVTKLIARYAADAKRARAGGKFQFNII